MALGKGAVTAAFLCRVPSWHSGNHLPSARHAALGKEAFAVKGYADSSLPSAKPSLPSAIALGKARVCCSAQGRSQDLIITYDKICARAYTYMYIELAKV